MCYQAPAEHSSDTIAADAKQLKYILENERRLTVLIPKATAIVCITSHDKVLLLQAAIIIIRTLLEVYIVAGVVAGEAGGWLITVYPGLCLQDRLLAYTLCQYFGHKRPIFIEYG